MKSVRTDRIIGRWWSELAVRVTPAMRSANEISPERATACVSVAFGKDINADELDAGRRLALDGKAVGWQVKDVAHVR